MSYKIWTEIFKLLLLLKQYWRGAKPRGGGEIVNSAVTFEEKRKM